MEEEQEVAFELLERRIDALVREHLAPEDERRDGVAGALELEEIEDDERDEKREKPGGGEGGEGGHARIRFTASMQMEMGSAGFQPVASGILPDADGAWMGLRFAVVSTRGRRLEAGCYGQDGRAPLYCAPGDGI